MHGVNGIPNFNFFAILFELLFNQVKSHCSHIQKFFSLLLHAVIANFFGKCSSQFSIVLFFIEVYSREDAHKELYLLIKSNTSAAIDH